MGANQRQGQHFIQVILFNPPWILGGGGGAWWCWWHFSLYFFDRETGSELSCVFGPRTQVCVTPNPTSLSKDVRLSPLHLWSMAFWLPCSEFSPQVSGQIILRAPVPASC